MENAKMFIESKFGGTSPKLYWPWPHHTSYYRNSSLAFAISNTGTSTNTNEGTPLKPKFVVHLGNKTEPITGPVLRLLNLAAQFAPPTATDTLDSRIVKLFRGELRVDFSFSRDDGPWPTYWMTEGEVIPVTGVSVTLRLYPDTFSYPVIGSTPRRRPRIFGRSDRPAWREIHKRAKFGVKFSRQRDKLVETPNDKGFGNDGTSDWKENVRDAAKRVAVDAAKAAVSSAAKGLSDAAAKKAGATIKKRAANALKEIIRKR